ncbi:MAG: adenine phosphoribosyltransferase [Bacteriovoracaceae bacterium]|nr:adenine phosphoribosyltransferase [Bacteriovoracaceae bacterium]
MDLNQYIDDVADFPKKGVIFKDISRMLRENFSEVLEEFGKGVDWDAIDCVAGIDARGFILGAALSGKHGKGFIPIRKKGKLPPPLLSETYSLEYGEDTLEIKDDGIKKNILLIDDVLATGGTLKAAIKLCNDAGLNIVETAVLIDLKFLNSFEKEGIQVRSLVQVN